MTGRLSAAIIRRSRWLLPDDHPASVQPGDSWNDAENTLPAPNRTGHTEAMTFTRSIAGRESWQQPRYTGARLLGHTLLNQGASG